MANLNKVVLVGHLVRDPEKKVSAAGVPLGLFTVAANYRYTDRQGKRQEEVAFVPCIAFGTTVDFLMERRKGALAIMSGRLRTESWEQDGTTFSRLIMVAESVQFAQKASPNETVPANGHSNAVMDQIPF